jgi:ABC-type sugar transport system substrate-binding protein
MRTIHLSRLSIATVTAVVMLAGMVLPAAAREGSSSKSIGKGIKCSTVAVKNADGTVTYTQVCRKGV